MWLFKNKTGFGLAWNKNWDLGLRALLKVVCDDSWLAEGWWNMIDTDREWRGTTGNSIGVAMPV